MTTPPPLEDGVPPIAPDLETARMIRVTLCPDGCHVLLRMLRADGTCFANIPMPKAHALEMAMLIVDSTAGVKH